MSKDRKGINIAVHTTLGKYTENLYYNCNKTDLIFRFPIAIYISFKTFTTMMMWCFFADQDTDPLLKPGENEDSNNN